MNRLGIKITSVYWITAAAAAAGTAAFSTMSVMLPVRLLWTALTFILLVVLGKKAALSCSSPTDGFPIGRAFLWSYISYVPGRIAASALCIVTGWTQELNMPDLQYSIYSMGDSGLIGDRLATLLSRLPELLQSQETFIGLGAVSALYSGVIMSLLAGAAIKINR